MTAHRFSIGEWYGKAFDSLAPEERMRLADGPSGEDCPFRPSEKCKKPGGVCSFLAYENRGGRAVAVEGETPRTMCPHRFDEDDLAVRWIAETLLHAQATRQATEVPFLRSTTGDSHVGRIDMVLIREGEEGTDWCAVEKQAVYFSGVAMGKEFKALRQDEGSLPPFPKDNRRPDYRSSGPKRLMPQLLIKVPTLRRWGKKMAVVVDEGFFGALGEMREANHISNADIVWFVLAFEREGERFRLRRGRVHATSLEHAVDGLTAGEPVSKPEFEKSLGLSSGGG